MIEWLQMILSSEGFGMLMNIWGGANEQAQIDEFNEFARERLGEVTASQSSQYEALFGRGIGSDTEYRTVKTGGTIPEGVAGTQRVDKFLEDPNIPEEDKADIRAQLEAGTINNANTVTTNYGTADFASQLTANRDLMAEAGISTEQQNAAIDAIVTAHGDMATDTLGEAGETDEKARQLAADRVTGAAEQAGQITTEARGHQEAGKKDSAGLLKFAQDRFKSVTGYLNALGAQQSANINADFNDFQSRQTQSLIDRGLMASSESTSQHLGVERERQRALGNLNENLNRQRLDYTSALSGDVMDVMGGNRAFNYGTGMDTLGFEQSALNTYLGTTGDQLNVTTGSRDAMFNFGNTTNASMLGANMGGWGATTGNTWGNYGFQNDLGNQVWNSYGDHQTDVQGFNIDGFNMADPRPNPYQFPR